MRVAVIGVGNIGTALATRLLDVGATVILHSRTRATCAPLEARGARFANSSREATHAADFVLLSLNHADIVEQVVFGPDGVAEAASADKLLLDFSSIDPARSAAMNARLARETGMASIDTPLSGGAPAALKGELVLMIGGTEADIIRARPVLDRLARRATHVGPPGAGQTVKLVNQVLCASGLLAVAEAVRFAEAAGVDAACIPEALAGGRADSRLLQEFAAKFARRDYTPTGRIANMLKDLETVQTVARANGLTLPVTDRIAELHRVMIAAGLGEADNTAYLDGLDLVQRPPVDAIVVMGPSGCGKTTLGLALAEALGWPYVDGDTMHPPENVAKMAAGHPLDDVDRAPFLANVARTIAESPGGIVVSCSALKRAYRETLRVASNRQVCFVLPQLSRQTLRGRMKDRVGHFMPTSLLASQLADLELPEADEPAVVVSGSVPTPAQVARVLASIGTLPRR